jgi:hypothetical protein
MQARIGQPVKVSVEDRDRIQRTYEGILRPGLDGYTEATPEDDGSVVFRAAPHAWWFRLHPLVVIRAREHPITDCCVSRCARREPL